MSNDEDYILIAKSELPKCGVIERDGGHHVDCGSDWGTWNVKHIARMRETALEYVAAWQTAEDWHCKQTTLELKLSNRRDELARELVEDGAYAYRFAEEPLKAAIDRIIELEAK